MNAKYNIRGNLKSAAKTNYCGHKDEKRKGIKNLRKEIAVISNGNLEAWVCYMQ